MLVPIMTLSGCGTTKPGAPTATSAQPTTTRAPETNKAPEMAKSSSLPGGRDSNLRVLRGASTVYNECAPDSAGSNTAAFHTNAQIFNPKTGRNVPIPVPTIPAGQRLVSGLCTVGGDADHIRVFYVVTMSTPSSGLTPESKTTTIFAFDPFTPEQPQTAPLPAGIDVAHISNLLPTDYGFILAVWSNTGQYIGFDGTTLAQTFSIPVPMMWTFANTKGILVTQNSDRTIYDARDGQVIGHVDGSNVNNPSDTYPDGFIVNTATLHDGHYDSGYFNLTDRQLKTPFPGGGDAWAQKFLALGDHSLTIRSLMDNTVIFQRVGVEYDGLHISNAYIAGNYLYIANDSDSPVIDVTTSQKVSSDWKVRPTDAVGRDWVLVKTENHASRSDASCFSTETATSRYDDNTLTCNPSEVTLRYAPGGKYDGPWF